MADFLYNVLMLETLLRTKLFVPPLRPNLVPRPQLLDRLNRGLHAGLKLTLISAQAGSGKTTLVSSWIHQLKVPAAWVSLDEDDNEPTRFIFYVLTALQEILGEVVESTFALLRAQQLPSIETILTLLINDLANLDGQVVLVLDDYHVIGELEIHRAMSFLLENQPVQLHLVIITRSDPAFPLHRWRGAGQMDGIYFNELRFTQDEVASFFVTTLGHSLSMRDLVTLSRRTEGWVAGLQLAALSMRDLPDPGGFVETFAGDDRYIADYLLGEVFESQPQWLQDFLLKTAVVDRFCASLCDAILGSDAPGPVSGTTIEVRSSKTIIRQLDVANLFTFPLDSKREWYRYHRIFADFLRLRLRERAADEVAGLHRRAAAWFEDHGHFDEAISHYLAAQDYQQSARLLEIHAGSTLWGSTGWAALIRWMEALPTEVISSRPRLSLQYAWALFIVGKWQQVKPILDNLEAASQSAGAEAAASTQRGEVIALRAWLAFEVDEMAHCVVLARRALERLPQDALTMRSLAVLAEGAAQLWLGQLDQSRRNLEAAINTGQAAGNMAVTLVALGCLVQMEVGLGRLREAAAFYRRARQLGTVDGIVLLSPTGYACVQMGEVLREWNALEEATALLREGVRLCRQSGAPEAAIEGQLILARVLDAVGNHAAAEAQMAQAEIDLKAWLDLGGNLQYSGIQPALVHRARYWLASGEVARIAHWLEETGIGLGVDPPDVRHLLKARVLLAQGQAAKSKALLTSVLPMMQREGGLRNELEALVLWAVAAQACGEEEAAARALSKALQMAEPEGYQRIFLDEGSSLRQCMGKVGRDKHASAYVRMLLAAISDELAPGADQGTLRRAGDGKRVAGPAQDPLALEPLTEREQSILRFMAAGLTNREIASELYLSVNTIKTYASRIYRKLNVHSRAEAVDRAHELKLF